MSMSLNSLIGPTGIDLIRQTEETSQSDAAPLRCGMVDRKAQVASKALNATQDNTTQ